MSTSFKTPGVYTELIDLQTVDLPSTAVPSFIGYTERTIYGSTDLVEKPTKIDSMQAFEHYFGGAPDLVRTVTLDNKYKPLQVKSFHFLYHSVQLYFANGGGVCYIVTIGDYDTSISSTNIENAIDALKEVEDVTLIAVPDAVALGNASSLSAIHQKMLTHCAQYENRFALIDLVETGDIATDIADFRSYLGSQNLKYGAAYAPMAKTKLPAFPTYNDISIEDAAGGTLSFSTIIENSTTLNKLNLAKADLNDIQALLDATHGDGNDQTYLDLYNSGDALSLAGIQHRAEVIKLIADDLLNLSAESNNVLSNPAILEKLIAKTQAGSKLDDIVTTLTSWDYGYDDLGVIDATTDYNGTSHPFDFPASPPAANFNYELTITEDASPYGVGANPSQRAQASSNHFKELFFSALELVTQVEADAKAIIADLEKDLETEEPIYAAIIEAVRDYGITVPPSAVVAGTYVKTDATQGVWKAAANELLQEITGPSTTPSLATIESMYSDSSGKSINPLRSIPGEGTVAWGARTLAGNDGEWRHIPVRRLYSTVERAAREATAFAIFEPNDGNTWLKIKSILIDFLHKIWRKGALVGLTQDEAFFVRVGIGESMTPEDVLEGKIIIEIGLAAVRPAEFYVIRIQQLGQNN